MERMRDTGNSTLGIIVVRPPASSDGRRNHFNGSTDSSFAFN